MNGCCCASRWPAIATAAAAVTSILVSVRDSLMVSSSSRLSKISDAHAAWIVRTERLGECHPRIAQIAVDVVAIRRTPFVHPSGEIVERLDHLGLTEAAVTGDAIDALRQQGLPSGCHHRLLQRLLEEDRDEQIAGA